MTYNLLMGVLNPTNSLTTQIKRDRQTDRQTDREENHKTSSLHAQSAPYSTAQICSNARSRFAREKEKFWPYCLADAIGDSYMEAKSGYLVKVSKVLIAKPQCIPFTEQPMTYSALLHEIQNILSMTAFTLLVGDRKGIRPVKKLDVGLLVVMI